MLKPALVLVAALGIVPAVAATGLHAEFTAGAWDGQVVPETYQCQKFGGSGGSPEIKVTGLPPAANAVIVEFNDLTYQPMDGGGHGKLGFMLTPGVAEVVVPSVAPHTFDLPAGFWTVAAHRAPTWDTPGAYLPPCSGGGGNDYSVTIKAVVRAGEAFDVLEQTSLPMGKY